MHWSICNTVLWLKKWKIKTYALFFIFRVAFSEFWKNDIFRFIFRISEKWKIKNSVLILIFQFFVVRKKLYEVLNFSTLWYSCSRWRVEDLVMPEQISQLFESHTFEEISLILRDEYPDIRGLSVKSIKRFCQTYGIKKIRFLGEAVASSVQVFYLLQFT